MTMSWTFGSVPSVCDTERDKNLFCAVPLRRTLARSLALSLARLRSHEERLTRDRAPPFQFIQFITSPWPLGTSQSVRHTMI